MIPGGASPMLLATDTDYRIERSLLLRSNIAPSWAFLHQMPAVTGDQKKFVYSAWIKRGIISKYSMLYDTRATYDASASAGYIGFYPDDTFHVILVDAGSTVTYSANTSAVYRDPCAFYHIYVAIDTTQAVDTNRMIIKINGVLVPVTAAYPPQNFNTGHNLAGNNRTIGNYWTASDTAWVYDGLLADVYGIDGSVPDATAFGGFDPITEVWMPKKYTGSYGTNGFHLDFKDGSAATSTAIGKDTSGNGNNFTPENIIVGFDSMIDTPTNYDDFGNGRGNYCVLSQIDRSESLIAVTDGALRTQPASAAWGSVRGSIFVGSGKWYWETQMGSSTATVFVGVMSKEASLDNFAGDANGWGLYCFDGSTYHNSINSALSGTAMFANDFIMCALDMDAGKIWFGRNGVWFQGSPSAGTLPVYSDLVGRLVAPSISQHSLNSSYTYTNFGQRPFSYTPPPGFKAINTRNLPDNIIKNGNRYVAAVPYGGTGNNRSITGVGFQPDLVAIDARSAAQYSPWYDSIRGPLRANATNNFAEAEHIETDTLLSFDADGFSLGASSLSYDVNVSGVSLVAWCFKKGATPGFDIVTYDGNGATRSFGHNLGAIPAVMIIKNRSGTYQWIVYHKSYAPAFAYLLLSDSVPMTADDGSVFSATRPTSSLFTVGTHPAVNGAGNSFVAYLWAEVPGFSKMDYYIGNGSANGTFIYCGFRPKIIWVKRVDADGNWMIMDTSRSVNNVGAGVSHPNLLYAENPGDWFIDIVSNGFKIRNTAWPNISGATYYFMAFAENPFKYSRAR